MFTTGMGTVATAAFAIGSMAIAVPTGVKIFNWLGTLWGGNLRMRTPLLFALGFIWMFMVGGFSGVMHAAAPRTRSSTTAAGLVFYFAVLVRSWRRGAIARRDPWDARTLEWTTALPPPEHNFDVIPHVQMRDPWWHEKYDPAAKHGSGAATAVMSSNQPIHMPSQAWFPILTASAILLGGLFFANHYMPGAIAGGALMILGIWLWSLEGPGGYHVHPTRNPP